MAKNTTKKKSVDTDVHQFGFDFILTGDADLASIEEAIADRLYDIPGIQVVGNPGLTGGRWTRKDYGMED